MKRLLVSLLCTIFLFGCAGKSDIDEGLRLRNNLLSGNGCEFNATVAADYGKDIYTFSMFCTADNDGNLTFSVTAPASIAGITGTLNSVGGHLTFDDHALAFPVLADGQISPVSAPWFFVTALRSGYMKACEVDRNGIHLIFNDSYAQDAIQVDVYTDSNVIPVRAEFLWQGRRILALNIENYAIL